MIKTLLSTLFISSFLTSTAFSSSEVTEAAPTSTSHKRTRSLREGQEDLNINASSRKKQKSLTVDEFIEEVNKGFTQLHENARTPFSELLTKLESEGKSQEANGLSRLLESTNDYDWPIWHPDFPHCAKHLIKTSLESADNKTTALDILYRQYPAAPYLILANSKARELEELKSANTLKQEAIELIKFDFLAKSMRLILQFGTLHPQNSSHISNEQALFILGEYEQEYPDNPLIEFARMVVYRKEHPAYVDSTYTAAKVKLLNYRGPFQETLRYLLTGPADNIVLQPYAQYLANKLGNYDFVFYNYRIQAYHEKKTKEAESKIDFYNDPQAKYELGMQLLPDQQEQGIKYIQEAARRGLKRAMDDITYFRENGLHGLSSQQKSQ